MTTPSTRFLATLMSSDEPPGRWAEAREREGWHGLAVPDHVFIETQPVAHLWVTATELALNTESVTIATSFANNLLRSPVEFAQASLALQRASGGRFEAGLGAGWDQVELEATGVRFPPTAGERAGRYIEAGRIVRQLFDDGRATFDGDWYQVDAPTVGPTCEVAPPLVVSVGGPRTTAALAPIADVVEVKLPGFATTGKGSFHTRSLREVSEGDILARLDAVRSLRGDVPLGMFVAAGCGEHPVVDILHQQLQGSPFADLFGEPERVAGALRRLADLGLDRVTIGAVSPETYELLAPALFSGERLAGRPNPEGRLKVMTEPEFRQLLAVRGYHEIRETNYAPGSENELHTHEFSALLMVLEGEFILIGEDGSETYLAGQTCEVPAGTVHAERTAEHGARVIAGIKRTPS